LNAAQTAEKKGRKFMKSKAQDLGKILVSVLVLCVLTATVASGQLIPGPQNLGNGRWAISTEVSVGHGDYIAGGDGYGYCPPQGKGASHQIEMQLLNAGAAALATKLATSWNVPLLVGSVAADQLAQLFSQEIHAAGGSGKEFLENLGIVESYAACKSANLVVLQGARIVEINGWAGEAGQNRLPCPADGNGRYVCKIGWSEWEWQVNDRVVMAVFKNWSGDRNRAATLNVIYAQ
jgi:hypothetical protein